MKLTEREDDFLKLVVEPYWSSVYKYVYALLYRFGLDQVKNEAEDIRSEVFVKLWERYRANGHRGIEGTFIFLVAANLVRDRVRYYTSDIRNVKVTWSLDDEDQNGSVREIAVDEKSMSPEKKVWLRERLDQVETCLKRLKPEERWAVLLDATGYSDREIADIMKKDQKHIRSVLPHAREKLRKYLSKAFKGSRRYEQKRAYK